MKKKEILIYDDEHGRSKEFKKKLKIGLKGANQDENFEIIPLDDKGFQKSIKALQERRLKFRDKKEIGLEEGPKDEGRKIDDASIFIIDYDLFGNQAREPVTGEDIAYVIRCFSRCQLIIGLNQYGMNSFDLTLRGHPESFADLNLGQYQLRNPDLWRGNWVNSDEVTDRGTGRIYPISYVILRKESKTLKRTWIALFVRFLIQFLVLNCFNRCRAKLFDSLGNITKKKSFKRPSENSW